MLHPKVAASASAGSVVTAIVAILSVAGVTVPDTVAAALVVVASFVAGFFKKAH